MVEWLSLLFSVAIHSMAGPSIAGEKLIVFVKAPRPGEVKTRLARAMGPEAACAAYCFLVEKTLASASAVESVELRFTPDDAVDAFEGWVRAGWGLKPQGGGDLGRRLNRAFSESFSSGAKKVLIIGSDCPEVAPADLRTALATLEEVDLVLGPANDGGYWLIGLRSNQPGLFENISWSSGAVLGETLQKAKSAGLSVHQLRTLSDVDTIEDWECYLKSGV